MLTITANIAIAESELEEKFIASPGPGGQNVNKVATAVQLRFDLAHSSSLSGPVRERLRKLAGRRVSGEGILIIDANRFRTQERNRQDARERLARLILQAIEPPKQRRATKPTKASQLRRVEGKVRRGKIKKLRREDSEKE